MSSILKKLGIETVVNLPGVGENLIEQPGGVAGTLSNTGGAAMAFIAMASAKDIFGDGLDAYREKVKGAIPEVARSIVDATPGRALSVKALEKQLRVQHDLLFNKNVAFAEIQTVSPPTLPATFTQFWILFPFARGSLHLAHSDELNTPLFDPRFFLTDLDLEGLAASGKVTQTFYSTSPMADIRLGPLPPPYDGLPDNATDAEMRAYHRNTGSLYSSRDIETSRWKRR
jgi:choline dehydrogenase